MIDIRTFNGNADTEELVINGTTRDQGSVIIYINHATQIYSVYEQSSEGERKLVHTFPFQDFCSVRHIGYAYDAPEDHEQFSVPDFGVTVLGSPHGFEYDGTSTGTNPSLCPYR